VRVVRALLIVIVSVAACTRPAPASNREAVARVVLVHQPLWGDPRPFEELLGQFRREHPQVSLETQLLPNDSDIAHQYFLTALEGGADDIDVFVADVVWIPEFALAGWIADLSEWFPRDVLERDFLPAAVDSVTLDGRIWAVPWYVDVGVLYSRMDLVPRVPRSWSELEAFARAAMAKDASLQGYLWQGRQYEGLTCNAYEVIWGWGGGSLDGGRLTLDTEAARSALARLRRLITSGVSPPSVTSAAEEDSRRAFEDGRAVFMRNWPYAQRELEKEGSKVRGKVAMSALVSSSGETGHGALGGWQLVLNARTPPARRGAAVELIRTLTSPSANLLFARAYGRAPARRATYVEPQLEASAPEVARLLPMLEHARPRPVTPYYEMVSDILQSEFSAAVTGIRSPAEALGRAQAQVDRVMGAGR
jgi:multiple sugar transport system substrate-binding protein